MARAGLDKAIVVEKAAQLANQMGLDNIQFKTLAEHLNIQHPVESNAECQKRCAK